MDGLRDNAFSDDGQLGVLSKGQDGKMTIIRPIRTNNGADASTLWVGMPFLLVATLIVACSDGCTEANWDGTVIDSAGVTIVSNTTRGMWRGGEAWIVEQDLVIGQAEGDAGYLFG